MTDNKYRLSPKDAQEKIRGIAKLGFVTPGPHCQKQMKERGYDILDIEYLLKNCKILAPPEYDNEHDDWKYEVKGRVIDGDKATVITVIVSHNEVFCVTVMDK